MVEDRSAHQLDGLLGPVAGGLLVSVAAVRIQFATSQTVDCDPIAAPMRRSYPSGDRVPARFVLPTCIGTDG